MGQQREEGNTGKTDRTRKPVDPKLIAQSMNEDDTFMDFVLEGLKEAKTPPKKKPPK